MDWVKEVIDALKSISPRTESINKAICVFERGQGFLTNDMPKKIFFWDDDFVNKNDRNAVE